jgi:hypothetical protein
MMAPAARSRVTNVASSGGRSFAYCTSAPDVVRMSFVSYWSLMATTTPWSGPARRPVLANAASCTAAVSSASGMLAALSTRSVMLRAFRGSNPHRSRAAGRKFRVESALIWPAFGMVETGPRIPCGSVTHGPL